MMNNRDPHLDFVLYVFRSDNKIYLRFNHNGTTERWIIMWLQTLLGDIMYPLTQCGCVTQHNVESLNVPVNTEQKNVRFSVKKRPGRKNNVMAEWKCALFSVFPNTMACENTQTIIYVCHQFDNYTTFAIHMTNFYDSKARKLVVMKYQRIDKNKKHISCLYVFLYLFTKHL